MNSDDRQTDIPKQIQESISNPIKITQLTSVSHSSDPQHKNIQDRDRIPVKTKFLLKRATLDEAKPEILLIKSSRSVELSEPIQNHTKSEGSVYSPEEDLKSQSDQVQSERKSESTTIMPC